MELRERPADHAEAADPIGELAEFVFDGGVDGVDDGGVESGAVHGEEVAVGGFAFEVANGDAAGLAEAEGGGGLEGVGADAGFDAQDVGGAAGQGGVFMIADSYSMADEQRALAAGAAKAGGKVAVMRMDPPPDQPLSASGTALAGAKLSRARKRSA